MLSPDPITQAPENGQNFNRYSYAFNNPMKFVDPSGFEFRSASGEAFKVAPHAVQYQVNQMTGWDDYHLNPNDFGHMLFWAFHKGVYGVGSQPYINLLKMQGIAPGDFLDSSGGATTVTNPTGSRTKLASEGGIAMLASGVRNIRVVRDLQRVIRRGSPEEVKALMEAINPERYIHISAPEIKELHSRGLDKDLGKMGVREVARAMYGALDVAANVTIGAIAKRLGVNNAAIAAVEIAGWAGDNIPDEYVKPKSVIDELIEKYGK